MINEILEYFERNYICDATVKSSEESIRIILDFDEIGFVYIMKINRHDEINVEDLIMEIENNMINKLNGATRRDG